MVQPRRGLGLAEEPAAQLGCHQDFRPGHLEGYVSTEDWIEGQEHNAASPPAQLALDPETAELDWEAWQRAQERFGSRLEEGV
jgi:hypothetical protein